MMDDKTRTDVQAQITALDKADESVRLARKPFDDVLDTIETLRQSILDKHDVEIAGTCEGCSKLLFIGDRGHRCGDGPLLCAECSPTWADVKEQWDKGERLDDEPEDRERFNLAYAAHVSG